MKLLYFRKLKESVLRFLYLGFSMMFLFSCHSSRNLGILEQTTSDTIADRYITSAGELKISKNDILGITVSSLNKELDAKFNTMITPSTGNTGTLVQDPGYPVDQDGNIHIHYIGIIKAENLTRRQLKNILEDKLTPYLKEPIVQVRFLSKKITVLGAVNKPQILYMPDETMPLLDALVMSGDLMPNALADQVYVIRDTADFKKISKVDLTHPDFLKNKNSILQPNDIVYVKKTLTAEQRDEKQRRIQMNVSMVASLLSVAAFLITVLRR